MQPFFGFVGKQQSLAPEENEALWDLTITDQPERKGSEISRSRSAWTPRVGDPFLKTQNQQSPPPTNKQTNEKPKREREQNGYKRRDDGI